MWKRLTTGSGPLLAFLSMLMMLGALADVGLIGNHLAVALMCVALLTHVVSVEGPRFRSRRSRRTPTARR